MLTITTILALLTASAPIDFKPIQLDAITLPGQSSSYTFKDGVLQGGVSSIKVLPKEFYGTWSVCSEMVESSHPDFFSKKGSHLWKLERIDNIIRLSNPSTGASASITVKEVKNKTASFTREKNTRKLREYENPKITVDGDTFWGTDVIITEYYTKSGRLIETHYVKYKVKGERISGPTFDNILGK